MYDVYLKFLLLIGCLLFLSYLAILHCMAVPDFSWVCYVSDLQNWKGETEEVENHWEGSTWMKSYIIKTHFGYHMDLVDTGYDLDMTIYTSCYYK